MGIAIDKFKVEKYSSYKDSGVQWLREIPEHWEVRKGKWLFIKQERPAKKEDGIITCFRDGQVTLRTNRKTEGFTIALKEHGYQGIRKGDLVIHNMDAFAGAIGISDSDGKSTPVYSACTPRIANRVNPYYYAYFLKDLAKSGFIESLAKGIRERSTDFRFNDFGLLLLSVPPLPEQTAIAAFLDCKTTLIDQAISIKQKQIELLKERRQILIHKAVTRGLNPNVKMKDSGVEWIGEIPEHWKVLSNKNIFKLKKNQVGKKSGDYVLLSLTLNGVIKRDMENPQGKFPAEFNTYQEVKKGDFIFCLFDVEETPRCVGLSDFDGMITGAYTVMESTKIFDKNFLYYYFIDIDERKRLKYLYTGLRNTITKDNFFSLKIVIPSFQEQKEISCAIRNTEDKIFTAISLKEQEIAKLKEYKATLINSAVTGKIKVYNDAKQN